LNELRVRTGTLLAAWSLVASFLGVDRLFRMCRAATTTLFVQIVLWSMELALS
jgi:hypothetical protein